MGIKCNLTFNIKAAHQLNVWVRKPWGLGKELFFFLVIWSKLFSPLCGWPDLLLSSLFAPQLFICKNEFKKHFRFPPCVKRETYSSHHVLCFHQIFFFSLKEVVWSWVEALAEDLFWWCTTASCGQNDYYKDKQKMFLFLPNFLFTLFRTWKKKVFSWRK